MKGSYGFATSSELASLNPNDVAEAGNGSDCFDREARCGDKAD